MLLTTCDKCSKKMNTSVSVIIEGSSSKSVTHLCPTCSLKFREMFGEWLAKKPEVLPENFMNPPTTSVGFEKPASVKKSNTKKSVMKTYDFTVLRNKMIDMIRNEGLSQQEIADKLGLSQPGVSSILNKEGDRTHTPNSSTKLLVPCARSSCASKCSNIYYEHRHNPAVNVKDLVKKHRVNAEVFAWYTEAYELLDSTASTSLRLVHEKATDISNYYSNTRFYELSDIADKFEVPYALVIAPILDTVDPVMYNTEIKDIIKKRPGFVAAVCYMYGMTTEDIAEILNKTQIYVQNMLAICMPVKLWDSELLKLFHNVLPRDVAEAYVISRYRKGQSVKRIKGNTRLEEDTVKEILKENLAYSEWREDLLDSIEGKAAVNKLDIAGCKALHKAGWSVEKIADDKGYEVADVIWALNQS